MREEELRARVQAFVQGSLRLAVPVCLGLALAGCKYGATEPEDAAIHVNADAAADVSTDAPGQDLAPQDGTAVLDGPQARYAALFPGPGAPGT